MSKRLVKIAKELNVGTSTIVEHLHKSGFEIENKPTAQVTDEMYSELLKEFQKSIAIKEKADQLVIGTRPQPKKETFSSSFTYKADPSPVRPAVKSEPTAKVASPSVTPPVKEPTATVVPKAPEENTTSKEDTTKRVPGLKVLGKIDLDKPHKPTTPPTPVPVEEKPIQEKVENKPEPVEVKSAQPAASVVTPPKEETPAPPVVAKETKAEEIPSPPVVAKETPKEEAPIHSETKPEEKVEEKSSQEITSKPEAIAPKVAEKPESIQPEPTVVEASSTMKETLETATPVPAKSDELIVDNEVNVMHRAATPELRGLKILGKIDTDKLKKPKKKKKEKEKPRSDQRPQGQGGQNRPAGQGQGQSGSGGQNRPTGQGGPDKKEGGPATDNKNNERRNTNNPEDQPKRRKRKRKVVSNTASNSGANANAGGGANTGGGGGGQNRGGNSGPNRSSGPGNNTRDNTDRRRPVVAKKSTQPEVKEVSKREIEEKIKATMARISGGGKKKRQKMRRDNRERIRERQELREAETLTDKLQLTEFISVSELASLMDVPATEVIMACMSLGVIVSINQRLDAEVIELVAAEFNHEVEFISIEEQDEDEDEIEDEIEFLKPRAPIVTVMGHVDHGKTSLLDFIRKADVAGGEAGGITQHIGAYEVKIGPENKSITFLDTPGHEAFTAMRARGAKVTDIAIVIVAADDSIMPQTREAISHSQAANVPIIFAINKIDKDGAQPEKIKQELASMNFLVEEWGGKYQSQDISAKTGQNIELLLEKVLLEAELLELTANPDRKGIGTVLEASLDKGRGYVTKTLVQSGTLKIGDAMVAGEHSGKVKAMFNERGKRVKTAGPATPVLILGLSGAPQAGERFKVVDNEQEARQIASKRAQIIREQTTRATKRVSLDEIGRRLALGTFKELNLIVKGDVDGSVEALSDSLIKLSQETVQVNVIHKAVGQIIESDVLLASASDAIVIGFQVRPSLGARKLAEREGVQIKTYSIIYEAIEEIKMAIEGMLEPTKEEKITGQVVVREVFKISKIGTVAGCFVEDGKINRNSHIRLVRDGIITYPTREGMIGEISSLKRFKEDVKEVKSGVECGISIKNFNDIRVDDIIEAYEIIEIKQRLVE
ncbi:MAG: translation initiation factor IF-2 [Saprospiraceae bacterium]